jgi:uncharacterized protein YbjT (DUF2867 family)
MKDKILVLGATGEVGAPLVDELTRAGANVRAASRNNSVERASEWVPFDFRWPATYPRALHGVAQIFLSMPLAPAIPEWTREFVKAAQQSGVKRVVKLSAPGVGWHLQSEKVLADSGLEHVILRACSRMQDFGRRHAKSIREKDEFPSALGKARVAHVDALDVAEAAMVALTRPISKKVYELTGPFAVSDPELAWILSVFSGREVTCRAVDGCRDLPAWRRAVEIERIAYLRAGKAKDVTDDVRELVGRPARPFAEYVDRELAQFVARPVAAPVYAQKC